MTVFGKADMILAMKCDANILIYVMVEANLM